ncbi:hypothetical protein J2752_002445 [Halarchaeum rubridurum]|uniref:Uncharacterized protein n=1 Tax=Halarchaeum rubridurum TaxID=489911 RepID=A0A8T4GSI4_9EURY|nr:hypothetical protein [Halarchaeum rubridurum]
MPSPTVRPPMEEKEKLLLTLYGVAAAMMVATFLVVIT